MNKPKGKLENELDELQQAQLAEWLLSGMTYHDAVGAVQKEFGLKVGHSAFQVFWERVCVPHLLRRRSVAISTSAEIATEAEKRPGQFDTATIDALKQKAFELAISPRPNPKDVKALFMLVLKARDQDLNERKIRLLEQKAEQAEKAHAVVDSDLTPEEKQRRLRQIFGMS